MTSFINAVAYYLDRSRGSLVVGLFGAAVVVFVSMANHFPGW